MSKWRDIYLKKETRKIWKEITARPKATQIIEALIQQEQSKYPLIELGYSEAEGNVYLSEEQRGNFHILGSPRQGKSKLLQLLIRHGIKNGQGATLLDPSENGETARSILKYCAKVGFTKVVYINPMDFLKSDQTGKPTIPCINPIKYKAPAPAVASNLMDVLRITWSQKSFSDTPRIQKYLPALINALHEAGMTLAETEYFTDRSRSVRRGQILGALSPYSHHRKILEAAFASVREWDGFLPTVNRLMPLLDPRLQLLLGSKTGLDFGKLITEKYLILVNLDPTGVWDKEQQITLGTLVLSELQYAVARLRYRGWEGKHYIYLDEAGLFATRKLADFLYYKPKTGLIFNFAHHSFDQFEDEFVLAAIRNATHLKMMFWVANETDRRMMMKDLGYGGELQDRDVSFTLSQTHKQYCAFRNNKRQPIVFRLKDVLEPQVENKVYKDFIQSIYAQDFYKSVKDIRAEINSRFAIQHPPRRAQQAGSGQPSQQRQHSNSNPTADIGQQDAEPNQGAYQASAPRKSVFDSIPDSEAVLQPKEGWKPRKKAPPPA